MACKNTEQAILKGVFEDIWETTALAKCGKLVKWQMKWLYA